MLRALWRLLIGESRPPFAYEVSSGDQRVRVEAPTATGLASLVVSFGVTPACDAVNEWVPLDAVGK